MPHLPRGLCKPWSLSQSVSLFDKCVSPSFLWFVRFLVVSRKKSEFLHSFQRDNIPREVGLCSKGPAPQRGRGNTSLAYNRLQISRAYHHDACDRRCDFRSSDHHSQLVSCLSTSLGLVESGQGFPLGLLFHLRGVPDYFVLELAHDVFGKISRLLSHNLRSEGFSTVRTPPRVFACLSHSFLPLSRLASRSFIVSRVAFLRGLCNFRPLATHRPADSHIQTKETLCTEKTAD